MMYYNIGDDVYCIRIRRKSTVVEQAVIRELVVINGRIGYRANCGGEIFCEDSEKIYKSREEAEKALREMKDKQ